MAALAPEARTVLPAYYAGCSRFWAGEVLYETGIHGFIYLPCNAWAFSPIYFLGPPLGDVLWRLLGIGLLGTGIWRLAGFHAARRPDMAFVFATALMLPATWSAARNGQANLHVVALMIHAALDLAGRRPVRAGWALVIATALKPIGIVPLLLFGALDRTLWKTLAIGLMALIALPLVHPDPAYVLAQWQEAWAMLHRVGEPGVPYTELFGGLQRLGFDVPTGTRTVLRVVAALLTLALALRAWRRDGRVAGVLTTLGLAAVYLMVFNPRTEANSYVILGAVMAPAAAATWLAGRRLEGGVLVALCLLLGTHLLGSAVHVPTKRWLKPLLALIFGAWLVWRQRVGTGAPGPTTPDG